MRQQLKYVLSSLTAFDTGELEEIASCFKPRLVSKNEILIHEGKISNEFFFVYKGCIRVFFMDKNGSEKTRYIMPENHIGTALTSFIAQIPSTEFVEALEETRLLTISRQDFFRLNANMEHWKLFYQRILEMAYSFQNTKIEQLVTLTARQRYEKVMDEKPFLIQRVSNKVLASYLDMREETLSRLKSM